MKYKKHVSEEQFVYAKVLGTGMEIGLAALVVTFILYAADLLTPHVAVNDLPLVWKMPVREYLAVTGIHAGWSWLGMIGKGDFINFIGIAFLAGITIPCYLAILPGLIRKKDTILTVVALLEITVLVLAASGVLRGGGH